jgi:hypothetical protein
LEIEHTVVGHNRSAMAPHVAWEASVPDRVDVARMHALAHLEPRLDPHVVST